MSIVKKPALPVERSTPQLEKFIEGAPDGKRELAATPGEDESVQITLRLSKDQLEKITQAAKREGIPRASFIKRCVFVTLERDDRIRAIEDKQLLSRS